MVQTTQMFYADHALQYATRIQEKNDQTYAFRTNTAANIVTNHLYGLDHVLGLSGSFGFIVISNESSGFSPGPGPYASC